MDGMEWNIMEFSGMELRKEETEMEWNGKWNGRNRNPHFLFNSLTYVIRIDWKPTNSRRGSS